MPWSYTSLTGFETCPRRYYHTRVAKDVVEPESEAMLWGNTVHKALENRVKGEALPKHLSHYEKYAQRILALPGTVHTEQQIALTRDLTPTTWFAKDVWVRGVFDVVVDQGKRAVILDYKTGKRKPESTQLELFAALASCVYQSAQKINTMFIWLKDKKIDGANYALEDIPGIWARFTRRVERLEEAHATNVFPPKVSGLCRSWCPCKQCEFCGR